MHGACAGKEVSLRRLAGTQSLPEQGRLSVKEGWEKETVVRRWNFRICRFQCRELLAGISLHCVDFKV